MGLFSSLTREQKESIGLLQIGTFLEYFDLMLYIHMAVLLNEIFFPKSDPHTTSLLAAFAFCSTFVFRPIGALVFGWVGDHIGRKKTIVLTTAIMAVSCVVMAILPTYAQIGIVAAWLVTICRIAQGISSMGELVGAQIYLTESFHRPTSYPVVASLTIASVIGGTVALGVATLVTSSGFNWRFAFWIGACVAIVTAFARTRLRETPEFLEMQRRQMKETVHEMNLEADVISGTDEGAKTNATWKEPIKSKALLSYFLMSCGWPLCFYLAFLYFNPILEGSFGYSPEDIIKHNFLLSIVLLVYKIILTWLSCYIHPIRILKVMGILALITMAALPSLITSLASPTQLFLVQTLILGAALQTMPAEAIFLSYFPIYRRFTFASVLFSISKALMYIVTSFGLIYLGNYFGSFGLWFITLPITLSYLYGVFYFENLERKRKSYPNLTREKLI